MNVENYCILCRCRSFDQSTKQPVNNFEPQKLWKYKQFWGLGPDPSCLEKNKLRKIKAALLKQYAVSLKKAVCKDRANRNGMQ